MNYPFSVKHTFIILFCLGSLIRKTGDVTWLAFLVLYGVDGCMTCHRIMLHENLEQASRKHACQIMVNEFEMNYVTMALIYLFIQHVISLVMVCFISDTAGIRWFYFADGVVVLTIVYIAFMKKYYHLHEEFLICYK